MTKANKCKHTTEMNKRKTTSDKMTNYKPRQWQLKRRKSISVRMINNDPLRLESTRKSKRCIWHRETYVTSRRMARTHVCRYRVAMTSNPAFPTVVCVVQR